MSKDENKENLDPNELPPPTLEHILSRSFEAMWYQAEVLHKREIDLLKENQEKQIELIKKLETNTKDGIYQFSQDIIATFKDMRVYEESRLHQIISMLYAILRGEEFPPRPDEILSETTTEETTPSQPDTVLNAVEVAEVVEL